MYKRQERRSARCAGRWTCRVFAWFLFLVACGALFVWETRLRRTEATRGGQPVTVESLRRDAAAAPEAPAAAFVPWKLSNATNATHVPVPVPTRRPTRAPTPCLASVIQIVASDFKNDDGGAKLWLHDDGDEWNEDKDARRRRPFPCRRAPLPAPQDWDEDGGAFFVDTKPIVDKNNVTWTVRLDESIGNYGVLVLHDKDLNGKMKTNAVGKPKEGVGASRGAAGSWKGGPRWGKAKFWVPPCSLVTVPVELWYS